MAKMGRPPKEVSCNKVISVRVTQEEFERIKKYADSLNKTVTQVMQEGINKLIEEDRD